MRSKIDSRHSSHTRLRSKIILILISTMAIISFVEAQDLPREWKVRGKPDLRIALTTQPPFRSQPVPLAAIRTLYVNISNAGLVAAQDFYVAVFISENVPSDPLPLPSRGTPSQQQWRKLVKSVSAGGSTRIEIPLPNRLPKGLPTGEFAIVAVVDSTKKISELDETNNVAHLRVKFEQVLIQSVEQDYHHGGPGEIYIGIEGTGFRNTQENKIIKVGSYEMTIYEWSNSKILGYVTLNQVNLGNSYMVYFADKSTNTRISNQVSLKLLARIYIVEPKEGPPGTEVEVWVADKGGLTQGTKKVRMGTVEAPVTNWGSGELIRITVPSLSPGNYELYLEDSGKIISHKFKYFKVL